MGSMVGSMVGSTVRSTVVRFYYGLSGGLFLGASFQN